MSVHFTNVAPNFVNHNKMNHKNLYESPLAEIVEMAVESVVCGPTNAKGQMGAWRNSGDDPWDGAAGGPNGMGGWTDSGESAWD